MSQSWLFLGSTLARVVDGDTFDADLSCAADFGFHLRVTQTSRQRFRLNGCNAAPLSTPSGAGASVALGALLAPAPFTLTSVGPYKYGDEWMAEVVLADGRRVTDVMVAQQWAAPWTGQGAQPLPSWPRTVDLSEGS